MKTIIVVLLCGLFVLIPKQGDSHVIFKNRLQEKYEYRSVSCFVCHQEMPRGVIAPIPVYTDLGELFVEELEGLDITATIESLSELRREDAERVEGERMISQLFLNALKLVEEEESDNGESYRKRFVVGDIEGIRRRD